MSDLIILQAPPGTLATETKQDDIITGINAIENAVTNVPDSLVKDDTVSLDGVAVKDTNDTRINPATEDKQDVIVTALGETPIEATSVDASSSGDNTIVSITDTPKLYYVCLSANGANSADVTAIVKIGATAKYKVSLKAGAIWARNIGAEKRYVTGSAGDDIIVNLSAAETVHVSVEYADAA